MRYPQTCGRSSHWSVMCRTARTITRISPGARTCLYARLDGVPTARADEWMERLQLIEAADIKVHTYSKGMKKKLMIARGRLLDCDTPTAFITRHAERYCDVQYDTDGETRRESLHLDDPAGRERLARILREEHCVRVHSREFRFEDVFRKLTGEAYR